MSEDNSRPERQSTRLSISIPVVISGVDTGGNAFSESVRTLIVNKHGGKIATTHHLAMGAEVLVENRAQGVVVKANVVWLGEKRQPGDLHPVGLQLLEARNVWGIAFPPDDWIFQPGEVPLPAPDDLPAPAQADTVDTETNLSSLAGEEITIRLLQELQHSADAHAGEFQDRLKQLTHRLGLEFEFDLRERAANAKAHEVGAWKEEIKALRESLIAAKEEMGKLEARIQELKCGLQSAKVNPPEPSPSLPEARRQLTALANSVVESMNRAAEAGLSDYRRLLQEENQESAGRPSPGAEVPPHYPETQRENLSVFNPEGPMILARHWREAARSATVTVDESKGIGSLHAILPDGIISEISLSKNGLFLRPYFNIISPQSTLQDTVHE